MSWSLRLRLGPILVKLDECGFAVVHLERLADRGEPGCDCDHHDNAEDLATGHVDGDDCPCGPTTIPVEHADGDISWITAHQLGPDADPEQQADRAATIFEGIDMIRTEGDE